MKKILFVFSIAALLAAGCNSIQQANNLPSESPANSTKLLAKINESGSTNTAPYSISINEDGSGIVAVEGKPTKSFAAGTADAQTLKNLLGQIPDISLVTTGICAKYASFGSETTITYNGKTSGDISCAIPNGSPQPVLDLSKFINNLELKLQINTSRNSAGI